MPARSASVGSASARPPSTKARGWTPCASSSSSVRACCSSSVECGQSRRGRPSSESAGIGEQLADPGETGLRATTQLPFESVALRVGGVDDPPARGGDLFDPYVGVRLHAGARHRQTGSGGDRFDVVGIVEHGVVVDEHGERFTRLLDRRGRSARLQVADVDRCARVVDESSLVGQPVADDERAVAESPGEGAAQPAGAGLPAEVDDQPGNDRLGPAAAQEVGDEHEGDGDDHGVVRPRHGVGDLQAGDPLDRGEGEDRREREGRSEGGQQRPPRRAERRHKHARRRDRDEDGDDDRHRVVARPHACRCGGIGDAHSDTRRPAPKAARRVAEVEVDQRAAVEVQGTGEDAAGEPGDAGQPEQRADAACRAVGPRHDRSTDETRADNDVGDRQCTRHADPASRAGRPAQRRTARPWG